MTLDSRKFSRPIIFTLLLFMHVVCVSSAQAANPAVFEHSVDRPIDVVQADLNKSFDNSRFFVIKEIDIGSNLSRFAEKWGENYNRNKLTGLRSLVFCSGWYANAISNQDPGLLGFCPLHLTLVEKDGRTTVLFNRPTAIANDSPARELLGEIEQEVIEVIKRGIP